METTGRRIGTRHTGGTGEMSGRRQDRALGDLGIARDGIESFTKRRVVYGL